MTMLTPPWDGDTAAQNAAYMLSHPDEYREIRDLTVWCSCSSRSRRRLIRVFAGPVEGAVGAGEVLLVPSYTLRRRTIPPQAAPAPTPGSSWEPLYAHCALCRNGIAVLYPDGDGDLARLRASGQMVHLVWRFGRPASGPPQAGDPSDYVEGDGWSDGPCGSWLLHVGPPTLSKVVQG